MANSKYFPDFETTSITKTVSGKKVCEGTARTTLRKHHKGQFYLRRFEAKTIIEKSDQKEAELNAVKQLIQDVYMDILFGKVDPDGNIVDEYGNPIDILDPMQESEGERMMRKFFNGI